MTRPYKYRVWNGREMVSPDYIDRQGYAHWREDSIQCQSQKIVQFTGLRDRKGQEIYEGDIVRYGYKISTGTFTSVGYVYYASDRAMFYITTPGQEQFNKGAITKNKIMGNDMIFKVIGNIYANPELLKP